MTKLGKFSQVRNCFLSGSVLQTQRFSKIYAYKEEQYMRAYIISNQPTQNKGVNSEFTVGNWSKAVFLKVSAAVHLYQNLL